MAADGVVSALGGGIVAAAPDGPEKPGDPIKIRGVVRELFEDGTGRVDFPSTGGGMLGVHVTPPAGVKVGEWCTIDARVTAAKPDTLSVNVGSMEAGFLQPIDLDRARLPAVP